MWCCRAGIKWKRNGYVAQALLRRGTKPSVVADIADSEFCSWGDAQYFLGFTRKPGGGRKLGLPTYHHTLGVCGTPRSLKCLLAVAPSSSAGRCRTLALSRSSRRALAARLVSFVRCVTYEFARRPARGTPVSKQKWKLFASYTSPSYLFHSEPQATRPHGVSGLARVAVSADVLHRKPPKMIGGIIAIQPLTGSYIESIQEPVRGSP